MKTLAKNEDQMMDQVIARLVTTTPGTSTDEIARIVHEEHRKLDGRPVRDYVSVLVERSARLRLHHHSGLIAA